MFKEQTDLPTVAGLQACNTEPVPCTHHVMSYSDQSQAVSRSGLHGLPYWIQVQDGGEHAPVCRVVVHCGTQAGFCQKQHAGASAGRQRQGPPWRTYRVPLPGYTVAMASVRTSILSPAVSSSTCRSQHCGSVSTCTRTQQPTTHGGEGRMITYPSAACERRETSGQRASDTNTQTRVEGMGASSVRLMTKSSTQVMKPRRPGVAP